MKKAFRVKNDMAKMTEQNRTKRRFVVLRRFMGICPVHKRPDDEMGLTLIELVIVLAVIGILSAIAVPTFLSYRNKAKVALAVSEIKMLEKKIYLYDIENLRLPEDLGEIDIQNITDPWGNPYRYLKIAEDDDDETNNWKGKGNNSEKGKKGKVRKTSSQDAINTDYDLYSVGRDGKSESSLDAETSRDDVVRANDGKHIGLASDYK